MSDEIQDAFDKMARWCYQHRTMRGGRIVTPDFSVKWGLRSGYTVTVRIKSRSLIYRGFEIKRGHKDSIVEAMLMARNAALQKIIKTNESKGEET